MNRSRPLIAATCIALASCSPPAPEPTPAPVAAPTRAPPPPVVSQPAYDSWMDVPQTPGDWTYRDGTGLSFATFGETGQAALFGVECMKRERTIRLVRGARGDRQVPMHIRAESADRVLTAAPIDDGRPMLVVSVQARDPLLDAMALSKGRFAVETGGLPTLYLPSWPEVTRVIEDCR